MSQQVFMVCRQLTAANGTSIYVPLKAYAKESDARAASETMGRIFAKMSEGVIVVDGKPVTKVTNLFFELGIQNVAFPYVKATVAESSLIEVRPNIIQLNDLKQ